ncbi:MAG: aromatic amino acid hydroxylase [Myxococcota bacterium]|nr:aromatic amino acid hydroxylase [Myxococcota bacterium]
MGIGTREVPPHLRRFVVEQDYEQYSAVDQAVWRFVLLQTYSRLVDSAHAAYRDGLAATGISVERIPSIAEMNEKLSRFGWGAACVDGFIPPRAFQEFQAHGILPIAAAIRTREHLVYTPAPDIIHEAAGHAPILPDPTFSAYVRRFGDLARKAFTLPEEQRVYQAFYLLSEIKEDPSRDASAVALAEAELDAALAAAASPSEVTRLSRLYWWTAEYGLVGRTDDYKIYGAGLLSSLGESHSCHAPDVRKLPLDERSMDVAYDITRPQPQLFVVSSFEALHDVLDRAARALAVEIGGEVALERAVRSCEVATVHFSSGAQVIGRLREAGPTSRVPSWLSFEGPTAFARDGIIGADEGVRQPLGCVVLTGDLADGGGLELAGDRTLETCRDATTGRHSFRFASGALVHGRVERIVRAPDGRLARIHMNDVRLVLPGRPAISLQHHVLLAAGRPVTAHAGSVDVAYHPETVFSSVRIPRPRTFEGREQRLRSLYTEAERAHRGGAQSMRAEFPRLVDVLVREYPDEWLLRWNLLESLLKAGEKGATTRALRAELEELEVRFDCRQPIASGLEYLLRRAA